MFRIVHVPRVVERKNTDILGFQKPREGANPTSTYNYDIKLSLAAAVYHF